MRYAHFAPLGRDLSRLVLGTARFSKAPLDTSTALFDAWVEAGGSVIDTGRQYGNAETIVGRWLRGRGRRDDVVVLTKGGHYDLDTGRQRITPADITADLEESLRQLGVDTIDLYLLHRDDPSQPVGPILETLNEHRRAGKIRAFGGSNWTHARLDEARAYAEANSLETFACSSPQLSLAVPSEPPWPGCISIHEPDALAWYARTQLPVFSWSSQAAGYFAGVDSDLTRVYRTADNAERLRRARELAERKGCSPTQLALAWTAHQPFPTYAIVGPADADEIGESIVALDVELAPDEADWLDRG
jgi:aryl-alcohol dehydrogenase-like predicted oxidoreductase